MPYGEINKLPYGEINKLPYGEINKLPYGEINMLPYGEINKFDFAHFDYAQCTAMHRAKRLCFRFCDAWSLSVVEMKRRMFTGGVTGGARAAKRGTFCASARGRVA